MVVKYDMLYPAANQIRTLHIYLPKNYEKSGKHYPVMYFFDGHNLFSDEDATFGKSWGLKDYLDDHDAELIIVGAECAQEMLENYDRRSYEYMPLQSDENFVNPFLGIGPDKEDENEDENENEDKDEDEGWRPMRFIGIGDETMRWLSEDVKAYIDSTYRTLPDREHTGIGGSSMGGLMTAYGIFRYNSVYSRAFCVSPAVPLCMEAMRNLMAEVSICKDTRVFFSWGSLEAAGCVDPTKNDTTSYLYKACAEMAATATVQGADARLFCQIGGRHCEADWEKQLPLALPYLWPELTFKKTL